MKDQAFASVIVPTRNRASLLLHCLGSLCSQDYPSARYEVIVVNDGSSDRTRELVEAFTSRSPEVSVRLEQQPPRGPNAARNAGMRIAGGDLFCFVDDDIEAPAGWLRALVVGAERHPAAGVFAGRIRLRYEGRTPALCGDEPLGETEFDLGDDDCETVEGWGANLAVRRDALALAGPFNEDLLYGGEEVEWEMRFRRQGGRMMYLADAVVFHRRRSEDLRMRVLMLKRFRRGMGDVTFHHAAGLPLSPLREELTWAMRGIGHRVRRGCDWGLLAAAQGAGRLWQRSKGSKLNIMPSSRGTLPREDR